MINMPEHYGFDPLRPWVQGNGYPTLISNWTDFLNVHLLANGSIGPITSDYYFTGCTRNGTMGKNCFDFTNPIWGYYDMAFYYYNNPLDGNSVYFESGQCADIQHIPIACLCLPTEIGTIAPTTSFGPTASPTGKSIIIYPAIDNIAAHFLGDRAASNLLCSNYMARFSASIDCLQSASLLCYSGGDDVASLPSSLGFSSAQSVQYLWVPSSVYANWSTFMSHQFVVPSNMYPFTYATGCAMDGTLASNCADFTDPSGVVTQDSLVHAPTPGPASFVNDGTGTYPCTTTYGVMCVCYAYGSTLQPTAHPTIPPTPE